MRLTILGAMIAALLTVACGSDSGSPDNQQAVGGSGGTAGGGGGGAGGSGGGGGSGGEGGDGESAPTREDSCAAIANAWGECGVEDTTPILEDCLADEEMSDERTAICATCVEAASCLQLSNLACWGMCSPEPVTIVFRGEGFDGFEGRTVYIDLIDDEGESVLMGLFATIDSDGTFDLRSEGFQQGTNVDVHFWADLDDDLVCGTSQDRHAMLRLEDLLGELEAVFTQDLPDEPGICEGFGWVSSDAELHVTGLEAPDGATAMVMLLQTFDGKEYSTMTVRETVTDGAFSASFERSVMRDVGYIVRWFVDVDGNDICDATDLAGAHPFTGLPGTNVIDSTPGDEAPRCSLFYGWGHSLSVRGSGFESQNDQGMTAVLVDTASGALLATSWGYVEAGEFMLDFTESVPGGFEMELLYFFDRNYSGTCEWPEVVGRVPVGVVSEDGEISVALESGDGTGVCPQINALFDL